MAVCAGGLLVSLPALSAHAWQQKRLAKRRGVFQQRLPRTAPLRPLRLPNPNVNIPVRVRASGVNREANALPLLAKMLRPSMNYEGVEVSNVSMSGMASEENIWGDTNGRTRREYISPGALQGDILLTAATQSYQFHNRDRQLFAAHWPVDQGDKIGRLRSLVKTGRIRIQITGEEMVAGRSATIVTISALNSGTTGEARRVLYLDKETGIRLRIDLYNSVGRQISSTYMKSITVGTPLDATKFDPRFLPQADTFPIFPEGQPMFGNVEQARSQVPFAIREPKQLPMGYALDGVWVFGENARANRASVLLRYSSGVNHFSLFETLAPTNAAKPLRPGQMRPRRVAGGWAWREPVPEGELTLLYTGHLPEADLQALQNSLH